MEVFSFNHILILVLKYCLTYSSKKKKCVGVQQHELEGVSNLKVDQLICQLFDHNVDFRQECLIILYYEHWKWIH